MTEAISETERNVGDTRKEQLRLRRLLQQRQTADFYYLIDVVGSCNLRCPSCPIGNYPIHGPKGIMSIETYGLILEKIAWEHPAERIFIDLYNWGEPSLHKQLGQIVRLTKEHGFGVGISSNLNVFPDMEDVVRANPSYIRISLSGYFNRTYRTTHRQGDVNLVKSNMYLLRYWMDRLESDTVVQVGFHVYRHNFPEDFRKMRQLCKDLRFIFAPTLAALMPVEKAVKAVDGDDLPGDEAILANLVVSMKERAELLSSARERHQDCQYRQKRTTINFDGSVPLCCATFEYEQIIARSFLDIARDELQAKKYQHGFCEECQKRSLDMVYTSVEPHIVEEVAVKVLGQEYGDFLKEWDVPIESVVEWDGRELTAQEAFDLAMTQETSGASDRASELYRAIVAAFPRHGEAWFALGRLAEAGGDLAGALKLYESAYAIQPFHPPYAQQVEKLRKAV